MSEMEGSGTCPFCGVYSDFLFSGSGRNGVCSSCCRNVLEYSEIKDFVCTVYTG
jgi:NMD protein affecting ribosome stability and mRNA decay